MAKRHATKMGIMGAVLGAINFKVSQGLQQLAEEAEMRKLDRLEQIQIAREGRAEGRDVRKDERTFAQQDKTLDSQQQHDVALTGLRHEYGMEETQAQIAAREREAAADRALRASEGSADRATQMEIAKLRGDAGDSILGDDGQWYPKGTALPAGVKPYAGAGISFAPSASKSGAGVARPGAVAPAPRRDFTGFSIAPAD